MYVYSQLKHEFEEFWHFYFRVFSYFYQRYPSELAAQVFSILHPEILLCARRTCIRQKSIIKQKINNYIQIIIEMLKTSNIFLIVILHFIKTPKKVFQLTVRPPSLC